jgi:hypothetical protein
MPSHRHHPDAEYRHSRIADDGDGYATGSLACDYCGCRLVWDADELVCPNACLDLDDEQREAER